jgi:hypothetical protein
MGVGAAAGGCGPGQGRPSCDGSVQGRAAVDAWGRGVGARECCWSGLGWSGLGWSGLGWSGLGGVAQGCDASGPRRGAAGACGSRRGAPVGRWAGVGCGMPGPGSAALGRAVLGRAALGGTAGPDASCSCCDSIMIAITGPKFVLLSLTLSTASDNLPLIWFVICRIFPVALASGLGPAVSGQRSRASGLGPAVSGLGCGAATSVPARRGAPLVALG